MIRRFLARLIPARLRPAQGIYVTHFDGGYGLAPVRKAAK